MPPSPRYRPSKAHLALGTEFFDAVEPAAFPEYILRWRNDRAAAEVGLESLSDAEWLDHFGRFAPLPDSLPEPLALRYHGHQFHSYNPQLGDGRGFLFAQAYAEDGRLKDLGTKGTGQTPYSRGGDGRLTLKGGVRELLATELLEARGVPTSRTFSLVETGEELYRNDEPSPGRSAALVRLSHSHIRIGTFQRLAYDEKTDAIGRLIRHCLTHYLPEAEAGGDDEARALAFLAAVRDRVARMGAAWMAAGFVHGVLNTDNINMTGESFDYGPWRFLPTLEMGFTAAYFDQTGLYAFGRQPDALLWNLTRLAECLLPFASADDLQEVLRGFEPAFEAALTAAILARLGLAPSDPAEDAALTRRFWGALAESRAPFEPSVVHWRTTGDRTGPYADPAFDEAAERIATQPRADAPLETGEDLLIDEVEALWSAIAEKDDWTPLYAKIDAIRGRARPGA